MPQALRRKVWQNEFGRSAAHADCPCCGDVRISCWDFEVGHKVARSHGGETNEPNLRPICSKCNKSMGASSWDDFARIFKQRDEIPVKMFNIVNREIRLLDILENYNPWQFSESTQKYRKPSYQRRRQKPNDWCARLVESIIENKHIGNLTFSEWGTPSEAGTVIWYNIEDGQTRLDACCRFRAGQFKTKYGSYKDTKHIFNEYCVGVTEIKKHAAKTTDLKFFTELCTNFNLLQEGSPLTESEKFWTQMPDKSQNFAGGTLLNFTLEMVNVKFKAEFTKYYDLPKGFTSKASKEIKPRLANLVTLCSGCIDPTMYKVAYTLHFPMMMPNYKIPDRESVIRRLGLLFGVFKDGDGMSRIFIKSLIGPMLYDVHKSGEESFISLWRKVFTHCITTEPTPKKSKKWMNEVVLKDLSAGNRTNARMKLQLIRRWFAQDGPWTQ